MIPDLRTLIFCNLAITVFLAVALRFYRLTQKTYPGFDQWTAGTACLGVGYLALFGGISSSCFGCRFSSSTCARLWGQSSGSTGFSGSSEGRA